MKSAIELAKEKLEALNNKGDNNSTAGTWKPKEGDTDIRVTPSSDGDSFQERYIHYGVGGPGFLCPRKNFDQPCAVCNFASSLFREGTDSSREMSKKIYAKPRYFSPVLVREEEDKGIRWWAYGKQAYEKLLKLMLNPKYGDFTDPKNGFGFTVTYTPGSGGSFAKTDITPDPTTMGKPMTADAKEAQTLVENMPKLDSTLLRLTSEEVQTRLDEFLASGPEEASQEREKYGATEEKTEIDKAFDGLKE